MSDTSKELSELRSANSALQERISALESRLAGQEKSEQRIAELSKNMRVLRARKSEYRNLANLLRMMCDNVPDMIWAKDMNQRYIFANKAFCRDLLGSIDTEEPIGKDDMYFADRERRLHAHVPEWHTFGEICRNTDRITMDSGTPQQFDEYGNIRGEFLFLDVHKAPFIDKNGKMIGTVGSARDVTAAREAEQALRNSRQKLALAMDLARLVYWEYDSGSRQFVFNDRFYQQYGTSAELEGGLTMTPREYVQRFVHPDDRARVQNAMEESTAPYPAAKILQEEFRIIRRDGEVRHILSQAWMDSDTHGQTRKTYGANQDITERKVAEAALSESNRLLQTIINTSPVRVFWKDRELRYLGCNPAFAKDAGANNPQDMIGKDDYQFGWKEQADHYRTDDLQVMESGQAKLSFDECQTTPDGRKIWLRTSKVPLRNESDEIIGLLGTYEDITERKQTEDALQKSEQQNRMYIHNCPDGIFVADENGDYCDVNAVACDMMGYSREEMLSLNIRDLLCGDSLRLGMDCFRIVKECGYVLDEIILQKKDGTSVTTLLKAVALPGNKYLAFCTDITERKLEREEKDKLEAVNQQLQKNDSLGRMAGAIAHHFNNRLQAVIGHLELAKLDLAADSTLFTNLTSAIDECYKAAEISGMMLSYLGKTPFKRQLLDLSEICRRSLPMLQTTLAEGIVLNTKLMPHGPFICANEILIQQVLLNLIINACEASRNGRNDIRLEISKTAAEMIPKEHLFPIDWRPQEGFYACIKVKDEGNGILKTDLGKIFDPFFSNKFTGRGMGLAVSLGIVKTHLGAISVNSKSGHGSTFRIYIPAAAP